MASIFLKWGRCLLVLQLVWLSACSNLLFYPSKKLFSTPPDWGLDYEDVWLASADGTRLHGWWLPAAGQALGTIYFLHGNAENISTHIASVAWLPASDYNVFLLDYRGYGQSEGRPTLGPVVEDVRAGYHWVQARASAQPLVVLGQSLGGGLAGYVAATEAQPPAALVLDAPVASYSRIAGEVARGNWLTWVFAPLAQCCLMPSDYDLQPVIANLRAPLLIFRSDEDRVVPPGHADSLYRAAAQPKTLVETRGPHIATFAEEDNRKRLLRFLSQYATPGS